MNYSRKNWLFKAIGIGILILAIIGAVTMFSNNASAPADLPAAQSLAFDYSGKDYQPKTYRVKQGSETNVTVTSTERDEVHFHGYDISKPVSPGAPAAIKFTADKTGRFNLELHESGALVGYIEVYP